MKPTYEELVKEFEELLDWLCEEPGWSDEREVKKARKIVKDAKGKQ